MKQIINIILLFFICRFAFAAGPSIDYKTVAVILSQDPNRVSIPTIELYRKIKENINSSDSWIVAPTWTVKLNLKKHPSASSLPDLGAIAAFNRLELIKGHAHADKQLPEDKISDSKNSIIAPVQIMLDTLALEGAIILDCVSSGTKIVKGCGLYYYDRSRGKIVASSRKFFRAGVTDASNWSNHLIVAMDSGLKKVKEVKNKKEMDSVLSFTQEIKDPMNYSAEIQFWGNNPYNSTLENSVPGGTINIYRENKDYAYGLGFSYSNFKGEKQSYNDLGANISFIPKAHAANSLEWQLPTGVGINQRTLKGLSTTGKNSLTQIDSRIFIGPRLMWNLGKSSSFGIGASYERYLNLQQTKSIDSNQELHDSALKFAFMFKQSF